MADDSGRQVYRRIIERIFADRYKAGRTKVDFKREDLVDAAKAVGVEVPRNLGDVVYSFRFRATLPEAISGTAPKGKQWVITGEGDALYSFTLFEGAAIEPRADQEAIKLPAATPEIVKKHTRSEEQALLAVVRYNRLVDIFLGVTAYSLQSHLRTKVEGIGQMEIDEVYVGLNKEGAQFIIPVQAKGGNDKMGISQVLQDHEFCKALFPSLVPRLIAAQFISDDRVAMMELVVGQRSVTVRNERHYLLTNEKAISDRDLKSYRDASES
jgi:hypothetical protein